jgi:hypothetical protein
MRTLSRRVSLELALALALATTGPAVAELTDVTQTPNTVNAGIQKSLTQQIGSGRGDIDTPDSSMYLIKRDPFRAIVRGRQLFQRKFRVAEGMGPRTNDGIGNIDTDGSLGAGLTDSCGACHGRPRGSAGFGGDVFTRPDSRDAPHLFGLGLVEMLADEITAKLRSKRDSALTRAAKRNQPVTVKLAAKGINYGNLTVHPDGSIDTSAVEGVNDDLRVRPFFAEGSTISMREFIVGAFNAEMGLEAPDPDLIAAADGGDVTTPAGMRLNGATDAIEGTPVHDEFHDADNDGVVNELPVSLVDYTEFYLLNYFAPGTGKQDRPEMKGKRLMDSTGCTACHIPDLQIDADRRVGHVSTAYDPDNGIFNRLFATVEGLFHAVDDDSGNPVLKLPNEEAFLVSGIYADFKRHDLGPAFWERNFDGTYQKDFMTEPLWGVGTSSPYGHDGRSINLHEVILRHGGEAEAARQNYARLSASGQNAIIAFLDSLILFPPADTASDVNPGDPNTPNYPQEGHGSIKLQVLFNDPTDAE